jgi:spore coat protein U-like protein
MTRFASHSALLLGAALALAPAMALAGTSTDTLAVSATVQTSCALNGGTMSFGQYLSGQATDLDVEGTINYANCPVGTLTFELDGGQSGDVNARAMKSGSSDTLSYQLYKTSVRNAVWGMGANAQTQQIIEQTPTGSINVYGRIPKGQTVAAGSYADTVNITLTF